MVAKIPGDWVPFVTHPSLHLGRPAAEKLLLGRQRGLVHFTIPAELFESGRQVNENRASPLVKSDSISEWRLKVRTLFVSCVGS